MSEEEYANSISPNAVPAESLQVLLIRLMKGVVYREGDERLWGAMLNLQPRVRDYVSVLNLDLVLDEAEGYAFLKSRPEPIDESLAQRVPRLVTRRPLSFPVSLLLALLRKKLAEFDAAGGDTRLVLSRDDIVELIKIFLPEGTNEAKVIDQLDTTIEKVVGLGFLHKLKSSANGPSREIVYEVRRILKAFVDAQWLAEFDTRLATYQGVLTGTASNKEQSDNE